MTTYRNKPTATPEHRPLPPIPNGTADSAVPLFIGYTARAGRFSAHELILKPTLVGSLLEFETLFGPPRFETYSVDVARDTNGNLHIRSISEPERSYLLYFSVKLFFHNGGRRCYIVSVGTFQPMPVIDLRGDGTLSPSTGFGLLDGLEVASMEPGTTLLAAPEAVKLNTSDYATLTGAMLEQCHRLGDRFALFDVRECDARLDNDGIARNRTLYGNNWLSHGAAYFPMLRAALDPVLQERNGASNVQVAIDGRLEVDLASLCDTHPALYQSVREAVEHSLISVPPSGAIAGLYAASDERRGAWSPPTNIGLASIIEPTVALDDAGEEALVVDRNGGRSINTLRAFDSYGTRALVALTLAGKDPDFRFVSARRLCIAVSRALREATEWTTGSANHLDTWAAVRAIAERYLEQIWRHGALAGRSPVDAFYVNCGFGSTMAARDVLEGRLIIEYGLALRMPGAFTVQRIIHRTQHG